MASGNYPTKLLGYMKGTSMSWSARHALLESQWKTHLLRDRD